MNDRDLRELVRAAVARHLGQAAGVGLPAAGQTQAPAPDPQTAARSLQPDASHYVYVALTNASGACVIEPNVPCNHCNYCKSHGH